MSGAFITVYYKIGDADKVFVSQEYLGDLANRSDQQVNAEVYIQKAITGGKLQPEHKQYAFVVIGYP